MVRVIFIGGLGRSGTTLLERILGELPGVCPLGELVHLWQSDLCEDARCGCGRRFSSCEFWDQVGDRAFGGWHSIDPVRVLALRDAVERTRQLPRLAGRRLGDAHGELVAEYASYYARVYHAASLVSGAPVVVDSSKHASLAHCLRWSAQIDLRVVHMIRDSRGVASSAGRPDLPVVPVRGPAVPPGRAAMRWNAHNAAFGLLRRRGVAMLRIRYEQLLADPVATVRSLAEFAGLPDTGPLDFLADGSVRLHARHGAGGNPMRFATGELPLRPVDGWRSFLPARHRWLVGALTAPLLSAYGYGRH